MRSLIRRHRERRHERRLERRRAEGRPDPAPSRLTYRVQRILLTPAYRVAMRVGVPFTVSAAAMMIYLADPGRQAAVVDGFADLRARFETRPEFMINLMAVDGASDKVAAEIRDVAQVEFPVSSFDLDLDALRASIAGLPAVSAVSLFVRKGGVLQATVQERIPVALWRSAAGLSLLDVDGVTVGQVAQRADRADLPLIVGHGADAHVAEALALLRAANPLKSRLRGLVRMGERRWDVALDRSQRILLPTTKPVQALERVIALHQAQDMLSRDLAAVDMRLAARPTIQMAPPAVNAWLSRRDIAIRSDRQ